MLHVKTVSCSDFKENNKIIQIEILVAQKFLLNFILNVTNFSLSRIHYDEND